MQSEFVLCASANIDPSKSFHSGSNMVRCLTDLRYHDKLVHWTNEGGKEIQYRNAFERKLQFWFSCGQVLEIGC